jgi:hypothetical protein
MIDGSKRNKICLAPAMGHSLAALLLTAFLIMQVETAGALDVGVSGGAAGVGAGLSAGIGSEGLSAGMGVNSEGSRTSASGSAGPSGIAGGLGANAGSVGASAQGNLGSGGLSAGAGVSSEGNGASVTGNVGPSGLSGGLGGNAGSAGATASASVGGQQGSNAGVGASLGGNGTSAAGNTSSASSSGAGSEFSGAGSLGASANAGIPSQGAPGQRPTAGSIASIAPAMSALGGVNFPESLWPYESGASGGGWFRSIHLLKPLRVRPGTPLTIVQSCRNALVSGASSYGATQVDVASSGRTARLKDGSLSAPIEAKIVFQRGNRVQVRQARITCRLDARGRMLAMY